MHRTLVALAAAGAALAAPASASAIAPTVHTSAERIDGTDQYVWTCVGRSLPPITAFTLYCNGEAAVGIFPVRAISGVAAGTPRVCWSGSFQWGKTFPYQWASFSGCREGEHLPL